MADKDLTGIGELQALLGQGMSFVGNLTFQGRIRIDGDFEGQIFSEGVLILGAGAEVRAEVEVGSLIIRGGSLWGNVRAKRLVEIYAPGKLYGNIEAPQVYLDKGVVFEGNCSMLEEPSEGQPEKSPPETAKEA